MGLKGYRKYKRRMEALELLASFGISEPDLRYLHEALAIVRELKSRADEKPTEPAKPVPTEEETKEIKRRRDQALKPEDIVHMFADDAEEFYPNGRKRS